MSFRFVKMATVYPLYNERFSRRWGSRSELTYEALFALFAADRYGWSDHFGRHLHGLGVEATELVVNLEPLQRAWAREHGVRFRDEQWQVDILLAQARALSPDVLFLQDLYFFDRPLRRRLRENDGMMVGWRAGPTHDVSDLDDLDLLLSSKPNLVEDFHQAGIDAEMMPHAFDPIVLSEVESQDRDLEFTFSGSLGGPRGIHADRHRLIMQLLDSTPLEVWGEVDQLAVRPWKRAAMRAVFRAQRTLEDAGVPDAVRRRIPLVSRAIGWADDPGRELLPIRHPDRWHRGVFGRRHLEVLGRSQLTLNAHPIGDPADNMRLFEATGMGACLVTDQKDNLYQLFDPGTEVVTYTSVGHCVEQVRDLLADPDRAREIGEAGRARTLREHTFADRAVELRRYLMERL